MVVDALSWQSSSSIALSQLDFSENLLASRELSMKLQLGQEGASIVALQLRPVQRERIQEIHGIDQGLAKIMKQS